MGCDYLYMPYKTGLAHKSSYIFCQPDSYADAHSDESLNGIQFTVLCPDIKVHGANMGPIWGRQDPGGPHVGPMDLAIWGSWTHGACS